MKTTLTVFRCALIFCICLQTPLAQTLRINLDKNNSCSYAEELSDVPETEYYGYYPSDKAVKVMEEILMAASLNPSAFELKVSNVKNAVATVENGKRYILYSQQFISQVDYDAKSKWIVYSILAHEIGHHILGHNFQETNPEHRKQMELGADEFSGAILRSMCAEEADAVAAISTLKEGAYSPNYPPVSARKEMISNSWYIKDQDLKRQGRDPCGQTIGLEFGEKFGKQNLAENVRAQVKEEEMIITFDAEAIPGKFAYQSYMTSPRYSNLTPSSIEWLSDPEKPGIGRHLVWYFRKDGYTKEQVLKPQGLGIAVFEAKKVPQPVPPLGYSLGGTAVLLGTGAVIYGSQLKADALDLYNNPYAAVRDPGNDVYQGGNLSRTETYNSANKKYRNYQMYRNVGIALIGGGVALLIHKIVKHKKSKVGNLFAGDGKVKVDPGIFFK
ncbi:MAG: hypothetical protein DHS20C18_10740 [Saprospiraceae bacterium]|nr:MAG: hypothetical protein DHS20C18_10740 [Saprospiraceae bacterium]